MSIKFKDRDNNDVLLKFKEENDFADATHVLTIPIYTNKLLFTQHKKRGIEFPGGKVEVNETSQEAAIRELHEETGATVKEMHYIAQYHVARSDLYSFNKDVYVVLVDFIEEKEDYLETTGPVLFATIEEIPDTDKSFLLKDDAILSCVDRMMNLGYY